MTGSRADCPDRMRRRILPSCVLLVFLLGAAGCATRGPAPDFQRAIRAADEDGHYLADLPLYPVSDSEGHAAVLAMVTDYWEPPGLLARLRPRWRAHRVGAIRPDDALETYLVERGLWGYWGVGEMDTLKERLRADAPVLVSMQERPFDRTDLALALVAGYDDARERILLYGLADEPVQKSYDDFLRSWRYAQERYLVVSPPERADWRLTVSERISRGRHHMAVQRYADAEPDFVAALEMDPGVARHYVELADAHALREQYGEAEPLYRAALRLDDTDARAMNNLAHVLIYSDGDLAEAKRWARRATALEPDNPRLLHTLGVALYRADAYREAARMLERARTRAMNMDGATQAEIAMKLVQVYHDDDLWHLARQTLADALAHDPDVDVPEPLRIHLRDEP